MTVDRDGPGTSTEAHKPRVRMRRDERHQQLLDVARSLVATMGYEATSMEEIAKRAGVSKPVLYEHFRTKEALYSELIDHEVTTVMERTAAALDEGQSRALIEAAALAFLAYIEEEQDGFRLLVRDAPTLTTPGSLARVIEQLATRVEELLARESAARGYDPAVAPIYARALIGMVALVGEWWLVNREPSREVVASHLVNLAWNGLKDLERLGAATPGVPAA